MMPTFIALDNLENEEPTIRRRIGFCSNPIDLFVDQGQMIPVPCSNPVFDDDIEAVELQPEGKRRVFCCSQCVEKLLPQIHEPEKSNIKSSKRLPGARIRYTGGEIIR